MAARTLKLSRDSTLSVFDHFLPLERLFKESDDTPKPLTHLRSGRPKHCCHRSQTSARVFWSYTSAVPTASLSGFYLSSSRSPLSFIICIQQF